MEGDNSADTKPDDGFIALVILGVSILIAVIGGIYIYSNRKSLGIDSNSVSHQAFTPPKERDEYIQAREVLNPSLPDDNEKLKKLLMRRVLASVPILITLQNEGQSIERLYKKGILTDDMHFRMKDLNEFFEKEFPDVQREAESLIQGWGAHVWQQGMQYFGQLQKLRHERATGEYTETVPEPEPEAQQEEAEADKNEETEIPSQEDEKAKKKPKKKGSKSK